MCVGKSAVVLHISGDTSRRLPCTLAHANLPKCMSEGYEQVKSSAAKLAFWIAFTIEIAKALQTISAIAA